MRGKRCVVLLCLILMLTPWPSGVGDLETAPLLEGAAPALLRGDEAAEPEEPEAEEDAPLQTEPEEEPAEEDADPPYRLSLDFHKLDLDMDGFQDATLSAMLTPEDLAEDAVTYHWSSSDPAVAMVSDIGAEADVFARQGGFTSVTVSASSEAWPGSLSVTSEVFVHEPAASLAMSADTMTLIVGEEESAAAVLTCAVRPATHTDRIFWRVTQEEEAVSFDAATGEVRAVGAGTALVTAFTANGLSAQCKVSVREAAKEAESPWRLGKQLARSFIDQAAAVQPPWLQDLLPRMLAGRWAAAPEEQGEGIPPAGETPAEAAREYVRFGNDDGAVGIHVDGEPFALHAAAFHADGSPSGLPLTWTSSERKVARVDENGVVTPVRAGKAVITARSPGGASASSYVTVYKSEAISAKLFKKTPVGLLLGKTFRPNVGFTPMHGYVALRWSASDPSVVTVDPSSGLITAVGKGEALVTAEAPALPDLKLSIPVVVSAPITSIAMYQNGKRDDTSLRALPGESRVLDVVIEPDWEVTSDTVVWISSAPRVASVDRQTGEVTAHKPGKAVITARTSGGEKATCTVRVDEPASEAEAL